MAQVVGSVALRVSLKARFQNRIYKLYIPEEEAMALQ
jgi:hypothetical protein